MPAIAQAIVLMGLLICMSWAILAVYPRDSDD